MRPFRANLIASLAGLATVGAAILAAAPALAVTDATEVADACGDRVVCEVDGAAISNASQLEGVLPEGVRVVVIPRPDQAQSVPSGSLAAQLRTATDADTVIVIEDHPGQDRFAVAAGGDEAGITESLYAQSEADGGIAVAAIADTLAPGGAAQPSPAAPGGTGLVIGVVAVALAVVVVGGLLVLVRARRRSRGVAGSRRMERELRAALLGENGEQVRESIDALRERAAVDPALGPRIVALADHVAELMVRARRRGSEQQTRLLQAQYKDTLAKLLKALGDDYYGDILRNPRFWNDADRRLEEVREAVRSVDVQAVENIRQVNESRDIEFQVALDALTRTVAEAKLSDVYPDRRED